MRLTQKSTALAAVPLVALAVFLVATASSWPGALEAARAAADTRVPVSAYVHTGMWWAALVNGALLLLLFVTARWWNQPLPPLPPRAAPSLAAGRLPSWIVLACLLIAAGLGAGLRLPRMEVGFSADEEDSLRHHLMGRYQQKDDGEVRFRRATWTDTLWKNTQGNNHVLYSVCARGCLEAWQERGPDREGRFAEAPTRIPSLVAGLGTIVLAGWFLHALGFSIAGLGAAFFLAIHPWHLRFSAESRGYAMNLFFVVLCLWLLHLALARGKWRYWIAYALAQCAMLASYAGSVYVPILLNGFTVLALLARLRRSDPYPSHVQLLRLLVANAVSAMIFLQLMAPSLPQIQAFLAERSNAAGGGIEPDYLANFWSYLAIGIPWFPTDPNSPLHHSVVTSGGGLLAGVLVPLAVIGGAVRLARSSVFNAGFALTLLLAAPLGYLHALAANNVLHIWYLLFALPGIAMLASLGVTGVACYAREPARYRRHALFFLTVFLALYYFQTQSQRHVMMTRPKEPLRDVVESIYGDIDPWSPAGRDILTAGFWSDAAIYDPWLYHAYTPERLFSMMERALREDKPLWVTYGHPHLVRIHNPELLPIVNDPELFAPAGTYYGLEEPQFTHTLLRFIGTTEALRRARDGTK